MEKVPDDAEIFHFESRCSFVNRVMVSLREILTVVVAALVGVFSRCEVFHVLPFPWSSFDYS